MVLQSSISVNILGHLFLLCGMRKGLGEIKFLKLASALGDEMREVIHQGPLDRLDLFASNLFKFSH